MERETAETPPNATQKTWGLLQLCEGFFFSYQLFSALHEGYQLHTELLQPPKKKGDNSLMNPFSNGQKARFFHFFVRSSCTGQPWII